MDELLRTIVDAVGKWMATLGHTLIDEIQALILQAGKDYWTGHSLTSGRGLMDDLLTSIHTRVLILAWGFLILRAGVELIRLYIAREAGEEITPPSALFRRIALSVVAIAFVTTAMTDRGGHGITYTLSWLIRINAVKYSQWQGAYATTDMCWANTDGSTSAQKQAVDALSPPDHHGKCEYVVQNGLTGDDPGFNYTNRIYHPGDKTVEMPEMALWLEKMQMEFLANDTNATAGGKLLRLTVGTTIALGVLVLYVQQALRAIELAFAWLAGPLMALSPLTNDDFLREGTFAVWIREVIILSFTQVILVVSAILLWELVDWSNGTTDFIKIVTSLVLLTIGTQGPRVLRQYAWGGDQAQGISSKLVRLPW